MSHDKTLPQAEVAKPSLTETSAEAPKPDTAVIKNDWLTFTLGQDTFYVIKAADRKGQPAGDRGQEEFRRALKRAPEANLVLLHIVVPSPYQGTQFLHRIGDRRDPLPIPQLIYRMPNSALCTFVIVQLDQPGILEAKAKDGTSSSLDLHDKAAQIEAFPHRWSKASPYLDYANVPVRKGKFMYGVRTNEP